MRLLKVAAFSPAIINPGAEVTADGHIYVCAPLQGKAIAGARCRPPTRARIKVHLERQDNLEVLEVKIELPDAKCRPAP